MNIIENPEKLELNGLQTRIKDKNAMKSAKATKIARAGKIAALFA